MNKDNLDVRQLKACKNIENAAVDYIFGLENGCFDTEKDSEEYQDYYRQLNDIESLKNIVYGEAISAVYTGDSVMGVQRQNHILRIFDFAEKNF